MVFNPAHTMLSIENTVGGEAKTAVSDQDDLLNAGQPCTCISRWIYHRTIRPLSTCRFFSALHDTAHGSSHAGHIRKTCGFVKNTDSETQSSG